MSLVKINYYQFHSQEFEQSPFSIEGVGIDPESAYDYLMRTSSKNNGSNTYYKCPSWKHKLTRTFLIKSPVDISLDVDIDNKVLHSHNLTQYQFDEYCRPTFGIDDWCTKDKVTIQLSVPTFVFWTNVKNAWIESRPHYQTILKNNLTTIPGWFNFSNWNRPLTTSFDVINPSKSIIINRGDPLFEVCFYTKNLDDGIKLVKHEELPKNVLTTITKNVSLKKYMPEFSQKFLFKNQKSKCPFDFFIKKYK